MKNLKKQTSLFLFGLLVTALMFSCNKDGLNGNGNLDDAQLIEAIQNSNNKVAIIPEELPSDSREVIDVDFTESYTDEALLAPNLGYEVYMRKGKGSMVGERSQIYFNIDGRKLVEGEQYGKKGNKPDKDNKNERKDCFVFVLPISFTMPDGSVISVENEEGWVAIKDWYESNPDSQERPSIIFPVDVEFEGGTVVTVNSQDEMNMVRERCKDFVEKKCFEFIYPITFIMPDGEEIELLDRDDWAAIKAWYEANPDSEEKPELEFPVDVIYKDGTVVTVNSQDEIHALRKKCKGEGKR